MKSIFKKYVLNKQVLILILVIPILLAACGKKEIDKNDISNEYFSVIDDTCFFVLPNAFSPDENGKNDILKPVSKNLSSSNYEFTVRDKRQKIVFSTTDINASWDGKENGKKSKAGNYIATVKGSLNCGATFDEHINICSFINCVIVPEDFELVFNNMIDDTSGQKVVPLPQNNEAFCP